MKIEQAQPNQFAVCLNNEGYKASLEVGKIYRVINDEEANANGLIRVIDESGEDLPDRSAKACGRGVVVNLLAVILAVTAARHYIEVAALRLSVEAKD